jgi:hypothetical protein
MLDAARRITPVGIVMRRGQTLGRLRDLYREEAAGCTGPAVPTNTAAGGIERPIGTGWVRPTPPPDHGAGHHDA